MTPEAESSVEALAGTPRKIGLTGGIGSGKSTVAAMLSELGVPILDLDRVGHLVTAPGSAGLQAVVDAFGEGILSPDGTLDRKALAACCFSDAGRTKALNALLHPLIWQYEQRWLAAQTASCVVIEASVLLESGAAGRMDQVVVVLADEALRLQRVLSRGRHDAAVFHRIVARQCSDAQRRLQADTVIENNADLAALHEQVMRFYERMIQSDIFL